MAVKEFDPVKEQHFGDDPVATRDTDHYQMEYVHSFVEKWDELIDWDRRAEGEGDFFIRLLKERGCKRVLDCATGTGYHSVQLLKHGFDVTSVDGSPAMLTKAFENARQHGYVLRTIHADWRWLNRDVYGTYDAVICLGNSFTHLFNEKDRRKTLAEFYATLAHDGVLMIDQRNYDQMLDDEFKSKHTYYYCGDSVKAAPEHLDEGLARFCYEFPDGSQYHLNMFPLRCEYLRRLMHEVGFQRIDTFGDFQETYQDDDPDFYVHIAEKQYREEDE
jgi:SAM-dependent methyltransferase